MILVGLFLLPGIAWAHPGGRRVFAESLAPMPAEAEATMQAVAAANLSETLEVGFPLRMRNLQQLRDRTAMKKVIPHAELERDYLPLASDYEALVQWLTTEGFTITQTDPNRLCVFAKGTLAQIQQSLQTEIVRVSVKGRKYHAARTQPSLPDSIATPLLGVNGLQPFLKMTKNSPTSPYAVPYSPHDILTAYNGTNLGVTGSGQKIAILIDTFPTNSDVTAFWANNNIPQSLSNLEEINVNNATLAAPSGEESMDVEWSSAIAPAAKIRVYASGSLAFTDLDKAFQRIISDLSTQPQLHQLSISLGVGEVSLQSPTQMQTDSQYLATIASSGVTVFVSSGDSGSKPNGTLQVEYYASDPSVTGVGGTSLTLNSSSGQITSETTWNISSTSATGGGASVVFPRPSWQTGTGVAAGTMRLVPDVAFDANPNTGAYVYLNGSVQTFGGTSLGAPCWAGLCALINQARANVSLPPVGQLNPNLYPLIGTNNFRDITSGNNGTYSAGAGYDEATGIGSPNIANLLQTLTNTSPGAPTIGSFLPASGPVATSVGIIGLNFTNVSAVKFNGVSAAFTVNSSTQITVTVPAGASVGPVTVVTAGGTVASAASFDVTTGSPATLYSTGFETSEGYSNISTLAGQKGWQQGGSGGNGFLTNNTFSSSGYGQQAYIGLSAPASGTTESLWQPVNYTPGSADLINFSVLWNIIDSTKRNGHYDRFRWSVFNSAGSRLFSIEADNSTNNLNYILDDNVTHLIGNFLTNSTIYPLQIAIDFTRNSWSATLSGSTLVLNQPVTTGSAPRNLGNIRAEWLLNAASAGNNYMLFDNYSLTKTALVLPSFTVSASASPPAGGTTAGTGTYTTGSNATLIATPNPGYNFVNWTENGAGVSGSASYTFPVTANRTLVANFVPAYVISAVALPLAGGTTTGSGIYNSGSSVTVTATPAAGYGFLAWMESGTQVSAQSSYTFTATTNRALAANFLPTLFSTWQSGNFTQQQLGDPAQSGDLANPVGDGICNLLDYAFGLSPAVHNSQTALPQAAVTPDGYLTLTYRFNKFAGDLTYIVEVSGDLQTWNTGSGYTSTPVLMSDDGMIQTLQVTDVSPPAPSGNRFIRLRVVGQ
jgi:kumamolisin